MCYLLGKNVCVSGCLKGGYLCVYVSVGVFLWSMLGASVLDQQQHIGLDSGEKEVGRSLSRTPAGVMVLCWWWVGVRGYQESVGFWGEGKSTFDPMARNYLIFR